MKTLGSILIAWDGSRSGSDVARLLARRPFVDRLPLRDLQNLRTANYAVTIVDMDLADAEAVAAAKAILPRLEDTRLLFVLDERNHRDEVQAGLLGAADMICRPLSENALAHKINNLLATVQNSATSGAAARMERAQAATAFALNGAFSAVASNQPVQSKSFDEASRILVDSMRTSDTSRWVDFVRMHHSPTFRHSMLVASYAVMFGQALGFSRADLVRLGAGGLVHDIGKAVVPLEILDKPGALTEEERARVEAHPVTGRDLLERSGQFAPELVELTHHHHELLDGSGYPDRLCGAAIGDLTRIITIADIYAAMTEPRVYKKALKPRAALDVMLGMEGKLDMPLVRAFETVIMQSTAARN